MTGNYDDIFCLPHPVSEKHAPMSLSDRAAQFAPFAALTGFDCAIRETARLTDQPFSFTESKKEEINGKLCWLLTQTDQHPEVTVTYFETDDYKPGGSYLQVTGKLHSIDPVRSVLILADGKRIGFEQIYEIE